MPALDVQTIVATGLISPYPLLLYSMREQRALEKKLSSVKTLGDSDEEDEGGAAAWVNKSRTIETKKKEEVYFFS